jgi:hypothetical protein
MKWPNSTEHIGSQVKNEIRFTPELHVGNYYFNFSRQNYGWWVTDFGTEVPISCIEIISLPFSAKTILVAKQV